MNKTDRPNPYFHGAYILVAMVSRWLGYKRKPRGFFLNTCKNVEKKFFVPGITHFIWEASSVITCPCGELWSILCCFLLCFVLATPINFYICSIEDNLLRLFFGAFPSLHHENHRANKCEKKVIMVYNMNYYYNLWWTAHYNPISKGYTLRHLELISWNFILSLKTFMWMIQDIWWKVTETGIYIII